jgi:hypothetical protein
MGFRCRAAAHNPKITMLNAKRPLELCKAPRRHSILEQKKWKMAPTERAAVLLALRKFSSILFFYFCIISYIISPELFY